MGAAWVVGKGKFIAQGLLAGLVAGVLLCGLVAILRPHFDSAHAGRLARMASTPGLPRFAWLVAAILLAPLIEEPLFRGILYGGFRKSFGAIWAAVLTTLIFIVLHYSELRHYPPATLGIATLALIALWFRLRSGAIGPAIAVHVAYNSVIALPVLMASLVR